jgi:hypothetical protein
LRRIARTLNAVWLGLLTVGGLLVALSAVIVLADSGHLSARMPTQVMPRRYAVYPLAVGIVLTLAGLVGVATS